MNDLPGFTPFFQQGRGPEFGIKNPVVVSPNPVNDILNISLNDISFLDTSYQIVDVNGRVITEGNLSTSISEISVGELSKGVYFIKFENQNLIKKVIKQ